MTVIAMKRYSLGITQYNNVTKIEYNTSTEVYTVTYVEGGTTQTTTFTKARHTVHIMES